MSVALFLLASGFFITCRCLERAKDFGDLRLPLSYLQYTSVFDLLFEILLGFGTVMVLMEGVRREVEMANRKLTEARDQARVAGPNGSTHRGAESSRVSLATAAARKLGQDDTATSGSVAVIDIDNLKPINDTMGHTAGDKAIRAVARAMRSLVRADDMLFRWGGDEFLVLMFKLPEAEASRRMDKLNKILERIAERWIGMPLTVTVSHGVAGFKSLTELGQAIETAERRCTLSAIM